MGVYSLKYMYLKQQMWIKPYVFWLDYHMVLALTHWDLVALICISELGDYSCFPRFGAKSLSECNDDLLSIGPSGSNLGDIYIKIQSFPFKTMHLNMLSAWRRHQMETFSALLAICAGTGEFPAKRPVTRSFDVFFDLRLNKRWSKQSWGWWFETLSYPSWRHSYVQNIRYFVHVLMITKFIKSRSRMKRLPFHPTSWFDKFCNHPVWQLILH